MRVADFLAEKLNSVGIEDVFILTGGGLMFLTDGVACNKNLTPIPCLHEQAASMSAIAYAQIREGYGCCYVTTGCGGTNTITGVLHAWQDHVPVIFVSGQCNRSEMMSIAKSKVRQIGLQEADIVSIVESITKYAVTIMEPDDAVYCIEKALYEAKSGNPGPVWLDIPMDIQEAEIDPNKLKHFVPEQKIKTECTEDEISYVIRALEEAERPIIIVGQGVRLAGACKELSEFIDKYQIPMVGTRMGWDIYPRNNDLNIGLVDTRGTRAGNFAAENADIVVCIGSRLSMMTTGYSYNLFLRGAKKFIVVDIDVEEHKKDTVHIDKVINADAKDFISKLKGIKLKDISAWRNKCLYWKQKWPMITKDHEDDNCGISKFAFIGVLNKHLRLDSVITTDAGATTEIPMQALNFTSARQRYLGSASQCEMGYSIPAAVGASVGRDKKEILCVVGDGSLQLNIQELQTIVTQKLPIKIFVWNNNGYGTIRGHQKTIFKGRYVGVDEASGTAFPNLEKISAAYGIRYESAATLKELDQVMKSVIGRDEPVIVDVKCWIEEFNPIAKAQVRMEDGTKVAMPLEDMAPFMDREEFENEMIVKPIVWWKK
ncbi:thiamine pyrophosphate-binding protein [Enterocloster asparagiformis]|uniref:Thiamine pyrophosphate-binding protein n=3 Tax=Enterocloster TaxID=2719313 RepID=A0A413F9L8_9FIRM|nr:thiamine pyrophosphate-binding protein [Enterocloster asparagiformis]RGX25137.1 thiamine pyrophosphate-binding protein [Enterocloster asparagiformis]UWO75988.1 thiamine pyrophosphate-binding protein [[Clostridium] asparagiforme DSM 15981]